MSSEPEKALSFFLVFASDPAWQYAYAEVYCNDFFVCQIDTEAGDFRISFFSDKRLNPGQDTVSVALEELLAVLEKAKEELRQFPNGLA